MTRSSIVAASGFAVDGAAPAWGAFAAQRDPLAAAARAFVGSRSPRLPRLDRATLAALVAVHLVLDDGAVPDVLFVALEDGSAQADRAFWATARGRDGADASPTLFAATLPSAVAGELAMSFGLRGPCVVLAGAGAFDTVPAVSARLAGARAAVRLDVRLRGWDSGDAGEARALLAQSGGNSA